MVKNPFYVSPLKIKPINIFQNSKPNRKSVGITLMKSIVTRQNSKCAMCKIDLDLRFTQIDHIKEVYKGGKSNSDNLQALCANCHCIKTHNDRLKQIEGKIKKKPSNNNLW